MIHGITGSRCFDRRGPPTDHVPRWSQHGTPDGIRPAGNLPSMRHPDSRTVQGGMYRNSLRERRLDPLRGMYCSSQGQQNKAEYQYSQHRHGRCRGIWSPRRSVIPYNDRHFHGSRLHRRDKGYMNQDRRWQRPVKRSALRTSDCTRRGRCG